MGELFKAIAHAIREKEPVAVVTEVAVAADVTGAGRQHLAGVGVVRALVDQHADAEDAGALHEHARLE